ncbi:MAG: ABC transporter permease [Clostridia bacterium]|nr:ABC transporter permease [Clostridia bacterium]
MLKLALRNIKSKPWRTVATVLGIAVAVAMIFAMLSFKGAVYDYISASETSVAGSSDIKIATQSSSDRITTVTPELQSLEGVESIIPSLYLYAQIGDEYVQARGFETGSLEKLQNIEVKSGRLDALNVDDVIISEAAAKHFGVKVGDQIELVLGEKKTRVFVGAIAKNTGYFVDDSPYLILGNVETISKLVFSTGQFFNEIYIKVASGADVNSVIANIKALDAYNDMQVELSHDLKYIDEQTTALTAPVVLAGAAVLVLAVVIVAFLFLISEKDKIDYISRLRIVGATNEQIFGVLMIESGIIAFIGGLVGSALALGVFALIIKLTLKTMVASVSALYLFVAAVIGIASAVLSSLLPIVRGLKGTIRQNQTSGQKQSKLGFVLPVVLCALAVVSVLVECLVESLTPYFAIVSLVLVLATLFTASPYVLKGVSRLCSKVSSPSVKTASTTLPREKRFARSASILTVGVAISVMLFMAWNITTTVFDSYIKNFEDFVFVSNIKADVPVEDFKTLDGVQDATKMVWQKSEIKGENFEKTVNLLGSYDTLDMINFEFITPKQDVKVAIAPENSEDKYTDKPLAVVDISLQKLYGAKLGDELVLLVENKTVKVKIAGFVKHNLFNGNYIIMSSEALKKVGVEVDTVLVVSSADVKKTVGSIKEKYASRNYYVVDALEAYRWDKESTSAVFDLVGTLAVVVGVFILIVSVFAALVGRSGEERARTAFLTAGMSKNTLLATEVLQHALIALMAFVLVFAASVLLTMSLIHALMLFGLYFEFVYSAWVVAVVGIVAAVAYSVVPLVLNFKKNYKLTRS